ncbi:MAG: hypothetical protein J7K81_10130 [Methanophagales archaeon]|nr:hypothetical protein [Methanophagales archaeon]
MEKNTRNRVALLGALLVTGLVLAGLGTALGVGEAVQGIMRKTVSVVGIGDQVTVYEDGKVIDNFTLPEGGNYTWETSDYGIHIGTMTEEEMEKRQAEHEAELNKWLDIAKNDSRVQELIEDKEYKAVYAGKGGKIGEEDTAFLTLDIEGKYYVVAIDLNSETVKSVEEVQSLAGGFITGPDGETKWSEEVHRPEWLPPIPSVPK